MTDRDTSETDTEERDWRDRYPDPLPEDDPRDSQHTQPTMDE